MKVIMTDPSSQTKLGPHQGFLHGLPQIMFPRLHLNVISNEDSIAMKQTLYIKRSETVLCGLLDRPLFVKDHYQFESFCNERFYIIVE